MPSCTDPEPQLIAESIGAFYQNNLARTSSGLPTLSLKEFPGIAMMGISPISYRIPITQALLEAVETGSYPTNPTIVQRLVPPVPD